MALFRPVKKEKKAEPVPFTGKIKTSQKQKIEAQGKDYKNDIEFNAFGKPPKNSLKKKEEKPVVPFEPANETGAEEE